ncbi:MAG: sulfatase-like hydrolase/transferase [Chloroflexota bacterium]|nr:sulfatase-like hydrolase/transferase [Chloroflexota bacterium]
MKPSLTRREFLKLAGLFSLGYAAPPTISNLSGSNGDNVLIILFDAWSASNTSLYGYKRRTTPNLERLADKAVVYHNHLAGSHFTTPGTASLLMGVSPWRHHAFDFYETIEEKLVQNNIFHAFPRHHRLAYTHNPLADKLLRQFMSNIDEFTPWENLYLKNDVLFTTLFENDFDIASIGRSRAIKQQDDGFSYSIFLAKLYEMYKKNAKKIIEADFPRGMPDHDGFAFFTLEDGIDWMSRSLESAQQPFLGYYHFFPPHDPYHTRIDFYNCFMDDGYGPQLKPDQPLFSDRPENTLIKQRRLYDEFILYVDAEFARLHNDLEQAGLLENTWLILTTDHGEMFERGIHGHTTPVFYQPVMNIPLLIFPPGQETRQDVYDPTSAIDLLPTLLHATGQEIPDWAEGVVLPPFSTTSAASISERDISSVQVERIDNVGNITQASSMLIRGDYKLMWFMGFGEREIDNQRVELYNIAADPEELHNLASERRDVADELLGILKLKLDDLNETY